MLEVEMNEICLGMKKSCEYFILNTYYYFPSVSSYISSESSMKCRMRFQMKFLTKFETDFIMETNRFRGFRSCHSWVASGKSRISTVLALWFLYCFSVSVLLSTFTKTTKSTLSPMRLSHPCLVILLFWLNSCHRQPIRIFPAMFEITDKRLVQYTMKLRSVAIRDNFAFISIWDGKKWTFIALVFFDGKL